MNIHMYVIIIGIITNNGGSINFIEFTSKENCEKAKIVYLSKFTNNWTGPRLYAEYIEK